MGTWGNGVFDSDETQEYAEELSMQLMVDIEVSLTLLQRRPPDVSSHMANFKFMGACGSLAALSSAHHCFANWPKSRAAKWESEYLVMASLLYGKALGEELEIVHALQQLKLAGFDGEEEELETFNDSLDALVKKYWDEAGS